MDLQENIRRKLIKNKQEQILEYEGLFNHINYRIQNRRAYENLKVMIQQRDNTQRKINNLDIELERL